MSQTLIETPGQASGQSAPAPTPLRPAPAAPAVPAVVQRLAASEGSCWVDAATLDAFLARGGEQILFFQGDPLRFPEVLDVAVVLPELRRHFGGRFGIGLVARADEDVLARRFAVLHWPSLVLLREGQWVAVLPGMLDWDVYLQRLAEALARPATRAPILLQPAAAGGGCH